jgi:Chalcone isomerase-like
MMCKTWRAAVAAAVLTASTLPAGAAEVAGVKLDDSIAVAGKTLVLNGAGVRTRAIFKVYAMGLYLTKKETTAEGVLAADGPRRVTLHMLRNLSGEDFGKAFTEGLNNNTTADERAKLASQITRFGETFTKYGELKTGDIVQMDWVPGQGMLSSVNGKPVGEPYSEQAFYNAVLRIWLGDKPADSSLKPQLLGGK